MAKPSFLGLPQELRDEIYRLLLISSKPLRTVDPQAQDSLPTEILRVNKQVFCEAFSILTKENEFDYSLKESLLASLKCADDPHEAVLIQAYRLNIRVPSRGGAVPTMYEERLATHEHVHGHLLRACIQYWPARSQQQPL